MAIPKLSPSRPRSGGGKPRNVYVEPTQIAPFTTWSVSQVRSALNSHDIGDLFESSQLVDQMRRDGQIQSDLGLRVRSLSGKSGLPFCVEPSMGVDNRRAKSVSDRIGSIWTDIAGESVIEQVQVDSVMVGLSVGRIEWEINDSEWIPRLIPLPTHGLRWNLRERVWHYVSGAGEDLIITPGDGTWFLHTPHGDRSWMWGAVRPLGIPWISRVFCFRDFARYCEKHGNPILKIKEPFSATDDLEQNPGSNATSTVYQGLRNMSSESVLRLPQPLTNNESGWDAQWMEPTTLSYEAFVKLLEVHRSLISQTLLGRDPMMIPRGGDGETAVHRVLSEFLSGDAEPLEASIREQILKPYIRFNYGAELQELAPWPRWDTRPVQDLNARATMLSVLGTALQALQKSHVDTDSILSEFQLDPMAKDDPRIPVAVPPPSPTPEPDPKQEIVDPDQKPGSPSPDPPPKEKP